MRCIESTYIIFWLLITKMLPLGKRSKAISELLLFAWLCL
jgi:hypothetical protein